MDCPQCKIVEMMVQSVKDNTVEFICKKCGQTVKEEIQVPQDK